MKYIVEWQGKVKIYIYLGLELNKLRQSFYYDAIDGCVFSI